MGILPYKKSHRLSIKGHLMIMERDGFHHRV
jgi:hypothetical protein